MIWSNSVHLADTQYFFHSPFNYDTHDDIIQPNKNIALTHQEFLLYFCNQFSIVPPVLSTLTVRKSSLKRERNNLKGPAYTFMCNYTDSSEWYM